MDPLRIEHPMKCLTSFLAREDRARSIHIFDDLLATKIRIVGNQADMMDIHTYQNLSIILIEIQPNLLTELDKSMQSGGT